MAKPLRLTDSELDAVFSAAGPLPVETRDAFLRAVAHALQQECSGEIGPGLVARTCRALQKEFFDPPDLGRGAVPRWDRPKPRFERISKQAV